MYAETTVDYQDFESCYHSVSQYIEGFYNTIRRHSNLNYLCPNDFEKLLFH
ncbi:IS3 family transposase [Streptococcus oralis]|uniref:IS3 family transposase n=1 Tax=Streptococcus oralis TaxID=1303 RepID=UPI0034E1BE73